MAKCAVEGCNVQTDMNTMLRNRYTGATITFRLCDAHDAVLSLLTYAKAVS